MKKDLTQKNKSELGTKEGETRATLIIKKSYLERLKDLSYWDRKPIKTIVDTIFSRAIPDIESEYEKRTGEAIKKRPDFLND